MTSPAAILPPTRTSAAPLFVLVAGEASGDLLGADLIAGLRKRYPGAQFAGIGGTRMRAEGMDIWHPLEQLSVMGLVEVLKHLPGLLAVRRDVYRRCMRTRPDAFIGIDAPDFNLGLERRLKRAGIRTAHYVSPSVWAWREGRAAKIGRSADRVLCLFPMEPAIYARHGVDARFVGHPTAKAFPIAPDKLAARRALGLAPDALVLALLPGSRLGEIQRLGRDFAQAAALLKQRFAPLHIVAPMANASCRAAFERIVRDTDANDVNGSGPPLSACFSVLTPEAFSAADGSNLSLSQTAMVAADAILLASGTAALEAMLAKRPMTVAYRLSPLTYQLVKALRLLRTKVYSLPNILSGKLLVPELMQHQCTPPALADTLTPMLQARALPLETLREFTRLHESLRGDDAHSAALALSDLLAKRQS